MTEFTLAPATVLALMPESGIRALLGPVLRDPASASGIPRCEVYLVVEDPGEHHARALAAGALELSPLTQRSWGEQYQPFTPFIETIRGLLLGTPLGSNAVLAIGWCVVITVAGYAWSTAIYERKSVR